MTKICKKVTVTNTYKSLKVYTYSRMKSIKQKFNKGLENTKYS